MPHLAISGQHLLWRIRPPFQRDRKVERGPGGWYPCEAQIKGESARLENG